MRPELLEALKSPQDLEATFETLVRIEQEVRAEEPEGEATLVAVLLTKTKFYILALSAQHHLIRLLREELSARATAPPISTG